MNYNEYGYKPFRDKIDDGVIIITELELREIKDVSTVRSIMGTGEAWDYTEYYPEETTRYYEIDIEYVLRADLCGGKRPAFLCEVIAFDDRLGSEDAALETAKKVYSELLKKRIPKN